jgi:Flp pilus assembly pilin Flp
MKRFLRKQPSSFSFSGQGIVEYALILVLVVLILVTAVSLVGAAAGTSYQKVLSALSTNAPLQTPTEEPPLPTPVVLTALQRISNIQNLIADYYAKYGRWPRTWSPYNYTDLGLDPADYSQPIDGLYISPHGSEVGIANKSGDSIEVYAKDLNGNTVHLVNGWSIWCPITSTSCYYHTVASGNEIDPSSIYATGY